MAGAAHPRRDDSAAGFKIYRNEGPAPMPRAKERGTHREGYDADSPAEQGMASAIAAGLGNGAVTRLVFSSPKLYITQAWFKSGFPLPLHSHDADCFYHIMAGSLRFGADEIGPGDGVFIPAGVPYSFTSGDQGAEFLEVRSSDNFDTQFKPNNAAYWARIVTATEAAQERWRTETSPLSA